jgi:hypothetical protein
MFRSVDPLPPDILKNKFFSTFNRVVRTLIILKMVLFCMRLSVNFFVIFNLFGDLDVILVRTILLYICKHYYYIIVCVGFLNKKALQFLITGGQVDVGIVWAFRNLNHPNAIRKKNQIFKRQSITYFMFWEKMLTYFLDLSWEVINRKLKS